MPPTVGDEPDRRPRRATATDGRGRATSAAGSARRRATGPAAAGSTREAAALAARARYAFRQRVVLAMLIARGRHRRWSPVFAVPGIWWLHGAVDLALVGYLVYLRRQVRMEEAIRDRRAARLAGTRRPSAADDPDLDDWARRGRGRRRRAAADHGDRDRRDDEDSHDALDDGHADADDEYAAGDPTTSPTTATARSAPPDRARRARDRRAAPTSPSPAETRARAAPPAARPRRPPLPAGTALVEVDEDDPELHDLDGPARPDYRRAAGE